MERNLEAGVAALVLNLGCEPVGPELYSPLPSPLLYVTHGGMKNDKRFPTEEYPSIPDVALLYGPLGYQAHNCPVFGRSDMRRSIDVMDASGIVYGIMGENKFWWQHRTRPPRMGYELTEGNIYVPTKAILDSVPTRE